MNQRKTSFSLSIIDDLFKLLYFGQNFKFKANTFIVKSLIVYKNKKILLLQIKILL
jgi:hypothetical protein